MATPIEKAGGSGADLLKSLVTTITHVVGQGVVALAAGCEIHLAVDPRPGGKSFDGTCWVRHPAGDLPDRLRRAIDVAGYIAELALERGSPDELDAAEVFDMLQSGELSAHLTDGITLADVAYSLDVLRPRWALVTAEMVRMSPHILSNTHRTH